MSKTKWSILILAGLALTGTISYEVYKKFEGLDDRVDALQQKNSALEKELANRVSALEKELANSAKNKLAYQRLYQETYWLVHIEIDITIPPTLFSPGGPGKGYLSGFLIEMDGEYCVLTAGHIHEGNIAIDKITVSFNNPEPPQEMELWGYDHKIDAALLKFKNGFPVYKFPVPVAKLGDSDMLAEGQEIVAFGSPLALPFVMTTGRVTRILYQNKDYEPEELSQNSLIMHDAVINPGNSGGPLMTPDGQVIGINVMAFGDPYNNFVTPMPMAVPINEVKKILADLKNGVKR